MAHRHGMVKIVLCFDNSTMHVIAADKLHNGTTKSVKLYKLMLRVKLMRRL